MEDQYLIHAINQLRNEVVSRDDATRQLMESKFDALQTSSNGILDHMKTQNGRLLKGEEAQAKTDVEVGRLKFAVYTVLGAIGVGVLKFGFDILSTVLLAMK
jgi:hypothetical protein